MSQSVFDKVTKGTIGLLSGASTGGVTAAVLTGGTIFVGGCAIAVAAAPIAAGAGVAAVASTAISGGTAALGIYGTAGCATAGGIAAVCGGVRGAAKSYKAPSKAKAFLKGTEAGVETGAVVGGAVAVATTAVMMHNERNGNHYSNGRHRIKGTRYSEYDDEEKKDLQYLKSIKSKSRSQDCSSGSLKINNTSAVADTERVNVDTPILEKDYLLVPQEIEDMNDVKAKATHLYTASQSSTINEALRENDKTFIKNNADLFCAIDGYIDDNALNNNERAIVYRGHRAKWKTIEKLWPGEGEYVRSTNYTSASLKLKVANDAHTSKIQLPNGRYVEDAPIIKIRIPKGVSFKQVGSVEAVSKHPNEKEGLIKPHALFKIIQKTKEIIILELQPYRSIEDDDVPFVRI